MSKTEAAERLASKETLYSWGSGDHAWSIKVKRKRGSAMTNRNVEVEVE